jgi:hypothetical protein
VPEPDPAGASSDVRRAGSATLADRSQVVWSVAQGRRGRRWREVRTTPTGVVSSLLLETDPAGRFSHTELSTAHGLLTLHPEGDGTLHGNAVLNDGVRHLALPWPDGAILVVPGSPVALAAAAGALGAIGAGEAADAAAVVVGADLTASPRSVRVQRLAEASWRFLVAGLPDAVVELDADGLPAFARGMDWPLEVE